MSGAPKILIIAEHDNAGLNPSTAKTLSCARAFKPEFIDIAVLGHRSIKVCENAARLDGVRRVPHLDRAENETQLAAILAPQLAALAPEYTHILAPNTSFGKDLLPRLAALLDAPQITDIMSAIDAHTFTRPIYAGNAIATVRADTKKILLGTVRIASFGDAATGNKIAPIETKNLNVKLPTHTRFISRTQKSNERPDLQTAEIVISGGRGIGSAENFQKLYELADKLGAAVGASRAAVDAGFVPNAMQVGQTGQIIAPKLYIAVAISGAIQHLAGIKDAGTIVAINKDAEAPIFEIADIGLVGDWQQILPELAAQLAK